MCIAFIRNVRVTRLLAAHYINTHATNNWFHLAEICSLHTRFMYVLRITRVYSMHSAHLQPFIVAFYFHWLFIFQVICNAHSESHIRSIVSYTHTQTHPCYCFCEFQAPSTHSAGVELLITFCYDQTPGVYVRAFMCVMVMPLIWCNSLYMKAWLIECEIMCINQKSTKNQMQLFDVQSIQSIKADIAFKRINLFWLRLLAVLWLNRFVNSSLASP